MEAEQYTYWPAHSQSPAAMASTIVKDVDMSLDMSLQYIYGIFPDTPTGHSSPTEGDSDSFLDYTNIPSYSSNHNTLHDENEPPHPLGFSPSSSTDTGCTKSRAAPTSTSPAAPLAPRPVEPDSAKENRLDRLAADDRSYSVKRRMQNREAQRRFRERKEEHLTTLEKRAAVAEDRYQKLLKDTEHQTTEAIRLRKDNKRLKAEAQRLRERWRTMLALLQPAQRLVALSVLLAGDAKDDELEEFMRSLKA